MHRERLPAALSAQPKSKPIVLDSSGKVASQKNRYVVLSTFILLLAFALRVAFINQTPPGLSHDEAYNGIAAMQTLAGDIRIFYEINKGIEPLIIYLEALAFYLFGIGPVQLRLVNISAGLLTVALVYPFTARLFNRNIALLAMTGVAISFWAIFVSRLTLRAVLLPPLLLLALYFFWRALNPINNYQLIINKKRSPHLTSRLTRSPFAIHHSPFAILYFALSGLCTGVAMYTYLSSRFIIFIPLTLFAYQLVCRQIKRVHWLGLLLFLVIWAIIFTPLAGYYWQNAESFTRRSQQVTTIPQALTGDVGPLLTNTVRTLGMFTFSGDTTARYNLDGRPVFDWLNGLLFYLGFGLIIWQLIRIPKRAAAPVLLLSAAFFMLLPGFITDDSPHFLRTIGALPLAYMFWALGLYTVASTLRRWFGSTHRAAPNPRQLSPFTLNAAYRLQYLGFIIALLLLTAAMSSRDYFIRWANAPEARHIYGADIAEVARYLQSAASQDVPAISAEYYRDLDRFRLDLHSGGSAPFAIWFDGRQSLAFPPPQSGISPRYIFPASAPPPEAWANLLQPSPEESGREYTLYRLPQNSPLAALQNDLTPLEVNIDNSLNLLGYQILNQPQTGGQIQLLLVWQALRSLPPGTDYTFLVQLRDSQGRLWLQTDGNGYDPGDWQSGIIGLQQLILRLPGDVPPRVYNLGLQVVNRQTGQPLPAAGGQATVSLGPVTVPLAGTPREVNPELLPNPQPVQTNLSGLNLRGYQLDSRHLKPGDSLPLTLHWQVEQQPEQAYRLRFSLVNSQDNEAYRWPALAPIDGEWPTSQWSTGYWVQDKLSLPIGPDTPEGEFGLWVGWVDKSDTPVSSLFDLGHIVITP